MNDTVKSLRDQLLQLKARHEAGALETAAYDAERAALERRLVDLVTAEAAAAPVPAPAAAASDAPVAEARAGKALWGGVLALSLVVAAAGYVWTGTPGAIGGVPPAAAQADAGAGHALDPAQIAAMTEKLAERLKNEPDNVQGWSMLGRAYMVLGKPAESVTAYERAYKLRPDDASILTDYADALAVKNGSNLEGEPMKLIERALKIEPDHLKALMLAGSDAFNRSDWAAAVKYFDRVGQVGPADDPMVQAAAGGATEARARGKLPPAPAASAPPATGTATNAAAGAAPVAAAASPSASAAITGTVTLAPALKAQAAPEDTVFIFARPAEGSRMPLAIVRTQVKNLPFDFRLDDSQAMSPAMRLSGAGRVIVGARVSKSGQAMPQPGDLEGLSAPVAVGAEGLRVEIAAPVK